MGDDFLESMVKGIIVSILDVRGPMEEDELTNETTRVCNGLIKAGGGKVPASFVCADYSGLPTRFINSGAKHLSDWRKDSETASAIYEVLRMYEEDRESALDLIAQAGME